MFMRVLIIGATGRIGSLALDGALSRGHEATVRVRDPDRIVPRKGLSVLAGDVRDELAISAAERDVHAARSRAIADAESSRRLDADAVVEVSGVRP